MDGAIVRFDVHFVRFDSIDWAHLRAAGFGVSRVARSGTL